MKKKVGWFAGLLLLAGLGFGLSIYLNEAKNPAKTSRATPSGKFSANFSGQKAFDAVKAQTDFGPRVPGTDAHRKAGDWLVAQLRAAGWETREQTGEIEHPIQRKKVPIRNIIGSLAPEKTARVLLASHWDSRPFADSDANPSAQKKPIDGANDGGSGVGVLLELARVFKENPPEVGVDVIFWDYEDTGLPADPESYCLGSRFWAENPHRANYSALYGINLDMVGGFNAEFPREGYSSEVGAWVYDRLAAVAEELGYQRLFPNRRTGRITDDHVNVIRFRQIPMIDLIHVDSSDQFISTWHTLGDRIDAISTATLEAVGRVIGETVYRTKP